MLVDQLVAMYKLEPGERFSYNSEENIIRYDPERMKTPLGNQSLLHEIAHASLGHFSYQYDLELFSMEIEAWEETEKLAQIYEIEIDPRYIEECLRSYDHWITKRATCPCCKQFGLQISFSDFLCVVCDSRWVVNTRKDKGVRRILISS